MFPFFPSLPNQVQTPGCNGLAPQQMMLPNLQQQVRNPCSQPNPVGFNNLQQIPSQLHAQHHQFQNPQMAAFNNQNMGNMQGRGMVRPGHPQMTPSPSLARSPNVPLAVQTPLMGVQPQQGNSCLQPHPQNLNQIAALAFQGQICNPQTLNQLGVPQHSGQFGINSQMHNVNQLGPHPKAEQLWPQNLSQNLNQVMGLLGQFQSQGPMLPLDQLQQLLLHALGITQTGQFNFPHSSLPVVSGPSSHNTFSSNTHLGPRSNDSGFDNALVSTHPTNSKAQCQGTSIEMAIGSQNAAQKSIVAMHNIPHSSRPVVSTPGSQNTSSSNTLLGPRSTDSGWPSTDPVKSKVQGQGEFVDMAIVNQNAAQNSIVPMQNSPSSFSAISARPNYKLKIFPSDSVQLAQASHTKHGKNDVSVTISGNSACRNFKRNSHGIVRREQSYRRFQKPNHQARNWGKGPQNGREREPQLANYEKRDPVNHRRRGSLKYTEEEIKQWREARKRNFPTAANIERKKHQRYGSHEALNEEAKICRQQLKDVLARQMEMGFEAAEVPSHYLSDPESKPCDRSKKEKSYIAGRYPSNGKRRRHNSDKWQFKRQKTMDEASPALVPRKREPTLLQRLLNSEIKRDRSQLLQVFRFMALNSFFDHWPDKPLEYPQVITKDLICEVGSADGKSLPAGDSTTSGVGKNFRAEEADGQVETVAADRAEESTATCICKNCSDSSDEDGEIGG